MGWLVTRYLRSVIILASAVMSTLLVSHYSRFLQHEHIYVILPDKLRVDMDSCFLIQDYKLFEQEVSHDTDVNEQGKDKNEKLKTQLY